VLSVNWEDLFDTFYYFGFYSMFICFMLYHTTGFWCYIAKVVSMTVLFVYCQY